MWFLIAAVERMDTTAFHAKARLGGVGRRGYDPEMLLTLFVYAMAQGESSSRRIERLCHTDVAFRVICAQDVPDHTVLARFRQRHEEALTGLLTESLVLAAELGMLSMGVVALDGTKIQASASRGANRSEATLRKMAEDYVGRVGATDAEEDALFGPDKRGDELPEAVTDRTDRGGRIQRALDVITARRTKTEAEEKKKAERAQKRAAARKVEAEAEAARAAERAEKYLAARRKAEAEAAKTAERAEKTVERAEEYQSAQAEGAPLCGHPPKGVDPVGVARARWERARAQAAARYEAYQGDLAAGVVRRGRPPLPPDEHCRVRRAWVAYQAALAARGLVTAGQDTAGGTDQDRAPGAGAGNATGAGTEQTADAGQAPGAGTEQAADAEKVGAGAAAQAGGPAGENAGEKVYANLTDPDSRLMKTRDGWVQGMNCQTSTSEDVFILTARATQDTTDVRQFLPTKDAVETTLATIAERTGRTDLTIGTMLADAGYDSNENLTAPGPDRLIADSKRRRLSARATTNPAEGPPPEGASAREKVNHRLRTPDGLATYRRRSHLIEAPNAWLKDGRGLRRFSRRGLAAVQSELSLAAGVTNLLRLLAKGVTTAQLQVA
ncbi:transposase [Georgenia sp. TF02-10]|uniref:transposase n=1 Tax=Georgenia sp. TF02-10 TaxID=2917725 RepID=UPI0027398239|nr:transposase [Georgenia sp. TF02-10]